MLCYPPDFDEADYDVVRPDIPVRQANREQANARLALSQNIDLGKVLIVHKYPEHNIGEMN